MSENQNNGPNPNKRKKKASFLKNARKYAKKGCFGRGSNLDSETYQYLVRMMEVYRDGFENEEDKSNFVEGFFQHTKGKEIQCSCNQVGCRVIETLLPFANDEVLKNYMNSFSEDLRPLCNDRFASHVLEELVTQSYQRYFKVRDESTKNMHKSFVMKISNFLLNNLEDFIWDSYGNYIIRTCLINLANIPKDEGKFKGLKQCEVKEEQQVVPEFVDIVSEYGERLLSWPQFEDLCKHDKTSPFLQILLRALHNVNTGLLKKYLSKLLSDCFLRGDANVEKDILPPAFLTTGSLMIVETFLQIAPAKYFTKILKKCFSGRILKLSEIPNTNFAVQKLITHCSDKSEFELIFEELVDYGKIINNGHTGIIWALADACKRLETKQSLFVTNLMKGLDCLEPEDRQKFFIPCLVKMKSFDEKIGENLADYFKTKLNLHGTLTLQLLLEFKKPIKIVNGLLEMNVNDLTNLFSNVMGSHIVDSFVKSSFVGEKSREKLVRKMMGSYQTLATTKYGSRSFEAIWNSAGIKHKMQIMEELCYKDALWSNSEHGKIIKAKTKCELYKRNKEDWKNSLGKVGKIEKLLKEVTS